MRRRKFKFFSQLCGMAERQIQFGVRAPRRGLHEITTTVREQLSQLDLSASLCHLFLQHTSASLIIQENADPSARRDLESFLDQLVQPQSYFTHTSEGPDDMPSHIKTVLTQTSLTIPMRNGELMLGRWQGIYLWEHRDTPPQRRLVVTVL